MASIAGLLGLADNDRSYVNVVGQRPVFDAVNTYLQMWNDEVSRVVAAFIGETTSDHKFRYYLPGGGRLQRRGGQAPSADMKAYGSWDVAFPLEDFGRGLGKSDVGLAYMRLDEVQRHVQAITLADMGTLRFELLKCLFNNTARTFVDPVWGSLTIQPLANADGTLYPPVIGSETEADDTHHIAPAYAYTSISNTNDPIVTMTDELIEHFGGAGRVIVLFGSAVWTYLKALTAVTPVSPTGLILGANNSVVTGFPPEFTGGSFFPRGYHDKGAYLCEYAWIPAGYLLALHLDAPKPLVMRVDPADTGLPQGLQLVSTTDAYPLSDAQYRHRFGLGVGNRLNGVFCDLTDAAGTFAIPTGYG